MNRLKLSKLSEFLSSSGSKFQTSSNARQPYVLSRQRGTVRQFMWDMYATGENFRWRKCGRGVQRCKMSRT